LRREITYEVLADDYTQYDLSFKLIVIGDSSVGKSCLTLKATKNVFEQNYSATVGFEFFTFNIKINNTIIKLQIWDTCGQEIYRSLITNFYRNSSLALMVYAIDNLESYENVDFWLKDLRNHSSPDVKVFLIGNKVDLEDKRKINKEVSSKYKDDNKLDLFFETSAKTGFNAKAVFIEAAKLLYKEHLLYKERNSRSSSMSETSSQYQYQKRDESINQLKLNEKLKKVESVEKEKCKC